jgi:hypothetical protein
MQASLNSVAADDAKNRFLSSFRYVESLTPRSGFMMGKLTKCAVVGGIVVFIWGMISWTVLPWHKHYMHEFQNEERVANVIRDNATVSGIYVLPCLMGKTRGSDEYKQSEQMMRDGPVMFAAVKMEGEAPHMAGSLVKGLILKIIGAYLITWLLLHSRATAFRKQVAFVTMVGLVIGLLGSVPFWIWFGFPAGMTFVSIVESTIGWFLGGLAIAKLAK